MTERMTPSEIANWLVDMANSKGATVSSIMLAEAAVTIRELEASNKARADIIYAQTKASEIDREKIKIATEALELVSSNNISSSPLKRHERSVRCAAQALARIKEVG